MRLESFFQTGFFGGEAIDPKNRLLNLLSKLLL